MHSILTTINHNHNFKVLLQQLACFYTASHPIWRETSFHITISHVENSPARDFQISLHVKWKISHVKTTISHMISHGIWHSMCDEFTYSYNVFCTFHMWKTWISCVHFPSSLYFSFISVHFHSYINLFTCKIFGLSRVLL